MGASTMNKSLRGRIEVPLTKWHKIVNKIIITREEVRSEKVWRIVFYTRSEFNLFAFTNEDLQLQQERRCSNS